MELGEAELRGLYATAMGEIGRAREGGDLVRCYHLVQAAHAILTRLIMRNPNCAAYIACAALVERMERELADRVPPGTPSVVSLGLWRELG